MDPGKLDIIPPNAILGGISFENCTVIDDQPRPYFILNATWPDGAQSRRLANVRFVGGAVEAVSKRSCRAAVSSGGATGLDLDPMTCTVKPLENSSSHEC